MELDKIIGPLLAVVITTVVLVLTKMFDYYQDKDSRDIKMLLDIQKGLKDNNYSGEKVSQIRKITTVKVDNYIKNTNRHLNFEKNHRFITWIAGIINFLMVGYFVTGFIFSVVFFLLTSIYKNEDFGQLGGITLLFWIIAVAIFGLQWIIKTLSKLFNKVKSCFLDFKEFKNSKKSLNSC